MLGRIPSGLKLGEDYKMPNDKETSELPKMGEAFILTDVGVHSE